MDKLSVISLLPQTPDEAASFISDLVYRVEEGLLPVEELKKLIQYPILVFYQLNEYVKEKEFKQL